MNLRFSLLLACLTLVMLTGEADAEKEPLWSYDTGSFVYSNTISADGEYIVIGSSDKVHLFDKDSETPIWNYRTGEAVKFVAISADGEYIAIGCKYTLYFFDKDISTPLWNWTAPPNGPNGEKDRLHGVVISADGEYIATTTGGFFYDAEIHLFNKYSDSPLWSYTNYELETCINCITKSPIAISADGQYIVASVDSYGGRKVYLFDTNSSTPLWGYTIDGDVRTGIDSTVSISADGEYIVAGYFDSRGPGNSHDGCIFFFGKNSSTPLWNYTVEDVVTSVDISADGKYIVAGSYDNNIYFFDKDISTPLWSYATKYLVSSVAISTDGEYIVVGSYDANVYFFNRHSNVPLWSYATEGIVYSVAISADGEYILAGDYTGKAYVFDREYDDTPPRAVFNWSYTNDTGGIVVGAAVEGLPTHFNAGGTEDNSDNSLTYFWDFGDGTNGTGVMVNHTFNNILENGFNVILTVTDSSGNQDQITYNIHPALMARPDLYVSTLTFSNETPQRGEEITINASIKLLGMEIAGDFEVEFFSDGESIGSVTVNSADINSGLENEYLVSINWVAVSGIHTIYVVVDSTNVVDESEEKNGISVIIIIAAICYNGDIRTADDGCNQCICVNDEWVCTEVDCNPDDNGNVTVTDADEDEEGISTLSVITTMAAVAVMALRRRVQ